jgi:Spy/CpxP family protein refolding chaperone
MQKTFIFLSAILLACTAQAQTTDGSTNGTDSTHHYHMNRNWGHRNGSDSHDGHDGFRSFGHNQGGWAGRDGAHHIHYTPEQRKQIRDINADYHKKATDLFKNDNLTLRQYKAGLIALQKDKKSKMQALLTPEQKDQIAKSKERAAENMQVMAAARMERLKIRLGLSDQQVAALKSKEETVHAQLKAIHENDDLLPQQKMEQFKEVMAKRKDIIKSVLTPDQLTKFNSMESAREDRD